MTNDKSRVNVHAKLTAVSTTPVEPAGKTHALTGLDHAMGLHTIHVIFYYRKRPSDSFDLDWLRGSLSEALSLYPPVTGRLILGEDGNWMVKCSDAGVRILRAKVGTTLDEWLRSADGCEERDLVVWEDMPEDPSIWSPFRIQINDFEGGGSAIGLSCSHMHVDLTSATLLFKSWTEAHRRTAIVHPPFYHQPGLSARLVPNTNTKSANYYSTKSKAKAPAVKMATATFRFSDSIIKQCLSEVHDKSPNATPFDLLAALFWTRVARLKPLSHDHHARSLSICIDFRKLMHAPLPYGYFGNAQHFSLLSLDADELDGSGLGHVVGLVHRHVSSIGDEEFWSVIDWLESRKEEGRKFAPPFRMYGPELTCVSMEHMIIPCAATESSTTSQSMMYAAMFENDGKPLHVSYHVGNVEGEGLIVVMPSPEEGLGRTVTVTLPEEEVGQLCEDETIMRLEPTVVLTAR